MHREMMKVFREQYGIRERMVRQFPDQRKEMQKADEQRERLLALLSKEQSELLAQWRDQVVWLHEKEKQRLFFQGMVVGLQLASSIHAMGMPGALLEELD